MATHLLGIKYNGQYVQDQTDFYYFLELLKKEKYPNAQQLIQAEMVIEEYALRSLTISSQTDLC